MLFSSPTLLYLKGPPGGGKITVARILQRELGWKLLWVHDFDRIIQTIGIEGLQNGDHAYLMDRLVAPVIQFILERRCNLIFVRASRGKHTVESVKRIVEQHNLAWQAENHPPYRLCIVNLSAPYETLLKRVEKRGPAACRVHDKEGLDRYLNARPEINDLGESAVNTDRLDPQEVAEDIKWALGLKITPKPLTTVLEYSQRLTDS